MSNPRRKYVLFSIVAAITIALDQWTKILAREVLRPIAPGRREVIEGFWFNRYSENSGVAFGMFQSQSLGGRVILSLVAATACAIVFYYLRRTPPNQTRLQFALALVGGGALGNLADRIIFGRVTDFIVWHWGKREWPAFNVADAALVVGVVLMAIDMLPRRGDAEAESEDATADAVKAAPDGASSPAAGGADAAKTG